MFRNAAASIAELRQTHDHRYCRAQRRPKSDEIEIWVHSVALMPLLLATNESESVHNRDNLHICVVFIFVFASWSE